MIVEKKLKDLQPDTVTQSSLLREEGDYFRRQPRVNINKLSYNHEQFKRYTKIFKEAQEKDDVKSERFFKVLQYVKEHRTDEKDELVRQFVEVDGFVPEMIAVPAEYENVKFSEGEITTQSGRKVTRSFIPNRSSKNLDKYDVWRCSDRAVLKADGKHFAVAKL